MDFDPPAVSLGGGGVRVAVHVKQGSGDGCMCTIVDGGHVPQANSENAALHRAPHRVPPRPPAHPTDTYLPRYLPPTPGYLGPCARTARAPLSVDPPPVDPANAFPDRDWSGLCTRAPQGTGDPPPAVPSPRRSPFCFEVMRDGAGMQAQQFRTPVLRKGWCSVLPSAPL